MADGKNDFRIINDYQKKLYGEMEKKSPKGFFRNILMCCKGKGEKKY